MGVEDVWERKNVRGVHGGVYDYADERLFGYLWTFEELWNMFNCKHAAWKFGHLQEGHRSKEVSNERRLFTYNNWKEVGIGYKILVPAWCIMGTILGGAHPC